MGACWFCWRRRTNGQVKLSMTATSDRDDSYQPYQGEEKSEPGRTNDQHSASKKDSKRADTDTTMKLLLASKNLRGKCIPYESLTLEETPSSGEVSICKNLVQFVGVG
ncbi:hypothetical protein V7S43_014207 [Phytophthora oleae]|uniref:Uncharacterized protein n=1 Tax=Phytophthora oleae TaxID=2107226 RepID=A0ABD3F544_9STRA